ncbi:MAG TPA: S9 family peptidase, partial [Proteiniphilum sp.]|nr:S9 family peptidase [Proteiniphilum sp.]
MKQKLGLFFALITTTMMVNAQNIDGDWKGLLSVQGVELELVFHLTPEEDGLSGTMDVPMQGAAGIAVDQVELSGSNVTLKVSAAGIAYS